MGNVLHVIGRDMKRLVTTPAAWLVVVFLAVLPSLYTWFNVVAFWNPYDNTGNLRVCVVNEDEGCESAELGSLGLGKQIVDDLSANDQLGWDFTDRATAMDAVQSGSAYAAFIIPSDFSSDVATLFSGSPEQPSIEYYVNEKAGPVVPKITDTGASTLDTAINDTFVSTVSATLVTSLESKIDETRAEAETAKQSAITRISTVREEVENARTSLSAFASSASKMAKDSQSAKKTLSDAEEQIKVVKTGLEQTSSLAAKANASLVSFSTSIGSILDDVSRELSKTSSETYKAIDEQASAIATAKGGVDGAIARGRAVEQESENIASELRNVSGYLPEGTVKNDFERIISALDEGNAKISNELDSLDKLSTDTAQAASDTATAATVVDDAVQVTLSETDSYRTTLSDSTLPAIGNSLSTTSAVTNDLSSVVASQTILLGQAGIALDQLTSTLNTTSDALNKTVGILTGIRNDLDSLSTDLSALGTSNDLAKRLGIERLDADAVADFMMSPTEIATEELYPLNAYGTAMAPLFINLTLWVGVFMLMVIMRLEVDDEGVKGLTISQRFISRELFLAPLAAAQAAICCTGCLALGVQTAHVGAFYATAIVASLTYLSIQYTLSTTLQHIGKALCIVLVFVQIPAATGLYPIEMTPDFFRMTYPLFPFTYGINGMREAIGGFAGTLWLQNMGVLLGFLVAFLAIGLVARPYLTNLNRLFAREIAESDIINVEDVELPARRYRATQIVRALTERDEYRRELEAQTDRFMNAYPKLKLGALCIGIFVPIAVTAALSLAGTEKVIILTTWLVWLLLVIAFLVVVEYIRDNLGHQLSLESMSDAEVRALYASRNEFTQVKSMKRSKVDGGKPKRTQNMSRSKGMERHTDRQGERSFEPVVWTGHAASSSDGRESQPDELIGHDALENGHRTADDIEGGAR